MEITIQIIGGRTKNRVVTLQPGHKLLIGRGTTCDIQVLDKTLSRTHCKVENDNGKLVVLDLGSSNGTYIGGKRVIDKAVVEKNQEVELGNVKIRIQPDKKGSTGEVPIHSTMSFTADVADEKQVEKQFDKEFSIGKIAKEKQIGADGQISEEYQKAYEELQIIYDISKLIYEEMDLDDLFDIVLDKIIEVCKADRGALLVKNRKTEQIEPATIKISKNASDKTQLAVSKTIVDEVVSHGKSIITSDAGADQRFKAGMSIIVQNIKSSMCVPLRTRDDIIGAIYVDTTRLNVFNEEDLALITAIGQQAGVAIHRAQLMEETAGMFIGSVRVLSASIEAKDQYTYGHAERVTAFSLAIAEKLVLVKRDQEGVWLAGLLHDVGKIGVPDSVLNKPGKLTDDEFDQIKSHPAIGHDIISNIPNIATMVAGGVRHHHERYDGNGYPDGLKGEEIPLYARIMAIADTYDAMTSDRIYRKGLAKEVAFEEIKKCAGTQFDPKLVELFIKCYEEGHLEEKGSVFMKYYGKQGNQEEEVVVANANEELEKTSFGGDEASSSDETMDVIDLDSSDEVLDLDAEDLDLDDDFEL